MEYKKELVGLKSIMANGGSCCDLECGNSCPFLESNCRELWLRKELLSGIQGFYERNKIRFNWAKKRLAELEVEDI